jgi:transcription antitermination factor NusG
METGTQKHWHALYTRPRFEKRVANEIQKKGILSYLPLTHVLKQWSDRKKWVDEPLFRGYVFIQGDSVELYRSLQTTGVIRMVEFLGRPAVVPEEEIDRIRRILKEGECVESCVTMNVGDRVSIVRGPLIGIEGRLVEIQGRSRLVVSVPSINQALRLCVSRSDVKMLN